VFGRQPHTALCRYVLIVTGCGSIKPDHLVIKICDRHTGSPRVVKICDIYSHAGASFPFGTERQSGVNCHVLESAIMLVAIELVRLRVVRNQQIGPTIGFVVEHRDPSDFELLSKIPLFAVTSSNVPSPRLWKSQQVSPRYASGVQYDLFLPSALQKTSCSGDHCT